MTAQLSLRDAALQKLAEHSEAVCHYLPLATARSSEDPEYVHKLRVATRRLTAVLDLFSDVYPREPAQALRRRVRKIRRHAGRTRDLDVRLEALQALPAPPEEAAAGVQAVAADCGLDLGRARKTMTRKLLNQVARLIRALGDLHGSLATQEDESPALTLGAFGGEVLPELIQEFYAHDAETSDPVLLHALRIGGKRLRYALETFAPLLGEEFHDELGPQFQKLQDALGRVQDAHVHAAETRQLRRRWKRDANRAGREQLAAQLPGNQWIEAQFLAPRDAAIADFRRLWRELEASDFRRRLERTAAQLAEPAAPAPAPRRRPSVPLTNGRRRSS